MVGHREPLPGAERALFYLLLDALPCTLLDAVLYALLGAVCRLLAS